MENSDQFFDNIDENMSFPFSLASSPSIFDAMPSASDGPKSLTYDFKDLLDVPDYNGPCLFDCPQNTVATSTSVADSEVVMMNSLTAPNSSLLLSPNEVAAMDATNAGYGENLYHHDMNNDHPMNLMMPENQNPETEKEPKHAFLTKTNEDSLEDGYKWRKYGQKDVKSSPYPRSYYRCITEGCKVKKHVERYWKDPSMLLTTYHGRHTHLCPPRYNHVYSSGYIPQTALASSHSVSNNQMQQPLHNERIWDNNVGYQGQAATMLLNFSSSSSSAVNVDDNSATCFNYANASSTSSWSSSFLNQVEQPGFGSSSSVVAPEDNLLLQDNNELLEDMLEKHEKGKHV